MGDSLIEHVLNLLKRFGNRLNRKIAGILLVLVKHKSAGSLGAVAGFAIAVIFTWRFMKPPSRPQSIQQKNIGSQSTDGASSQGDEVSLNSNVDTNEAIHSPLALTLGQIVRRKLNGSRKMTCQLLGVILEENIPEELQSHATVRPSVVNVLLEINKSCDLYLMERILDDESEDRILLALENAGLFGDGGLTKEKVLFCSTENGRSSFVRQLEPDWHVDTNFDILSQQSRFIRYQLHITPVRLTAASSNIFDSRSLDDHFSEERFN